MAEVWIYHPTLDAYAEVPESAVGHHAMSGWVQQNPPPEPEPEEEAEEKPVVPAPRRAAKSAEAATEGDEK